MCDVEDVKDPPSAKPPATSHDSTAKKRRQMSCMNCREKKTKCSLASEDAVLPSIPLFARTCTSCQLKNLFCGGPLPTPLKMSKYSNKQKSDSNNARFGGVYYEEQRSAPASRDWLSEHNVQTFDSDDLRDWMSATRRQLGTQTMALVVARGLKSMNIAQPPLKPSSHNHSIYSNSSYSHGYSDGYGNNKTRARSVSVEPTFGRVDSKSGKYNNSSQQVYGSNGYSNQQWSNTKSHDPYAMGETYGNTTKHAKGYQTSDYPTSYPSVNSYPMTSNGKKTAPNAYMYDQSRTDNYHYGGVQQIPYAQQASYPTAYEEHSSRTSDSSQYGSGSFKE